MKRKITLFLGAALLLAAASVNAQTYKAGFNTKLVLPSAGTDPTNNFTITSGTLTGPLSWTLPDSAGASGDVLVTNGSGVLGWAPATSSVTLGGDVTGASGSNTIATVAGPDIVAALNSTAVAKSIHADALSYDATLTVTSNALGLDLTHANTWTGIQTFNAGLTEAGGAANLATTDASGVNIGTGSFTNAIGIGNGNGSSGTYSTTTIAGLVDFTGAVSLPSGSVSASSIGLASGDILIGDGSGHAAAQPVTGDVTISASGVTAIGAGKVTNADLANSSLTVTAGTGLSGGGSASLGGSTTVSLDVTHANTWTGEQTLSATGTGLNVTTDATVGGTLGVTGQTTLGSTALSQATTVVAASTLALSTDHSYFPLSSTSPVTVTSITGAGSAAGQMIVLVNTNTTPANTITLSHTGALALNGSDVIMGDGGTVTLLYDGTNWRLISAE